MPLLAGEGLAIVRSLHLIEELGSHLGLNINFPKANYSAGKTPCFFPATVKSSIPP